jgi:hypothetical protein
MEDVMGLTNRVPKQALIAAGLEAMRQAGMPLERVEGADVRSAIYRLPDGRTVRVRTCNRPSFLVTGDDDNPNRAKLNITGTDLLLYVFPKKARTPGPVFTYLIPVPVAEAEVRKRRRAWLETDPDTAGDNRAFVLWFTPVPWCPPLGNLHEDWAQYQLDVEASTAGQTWTVGAPEWEKPAAFANALAALPEVSACRRALAAALELPEGEIALAVDLLSGKLRFHL